MRTSKILVYNMGYFISKGGLDALSTRFGRQDIRFPVPLFKLYIGIWHKV